MASREFLDRAREKISPGGIGTLSEEVLWNQDPAAPGASPAVTVFGSAAGYDGPQPELSEVGLPVVWGGARGGIMERAIQKPKL